MKHCPSPPFIAVHPPPSPLAPFGFGFRGRARRRTLVGVGGLVVLAHLALLGAAGGIEIGAGRQAAVGATMAVRTIEGPVEMLSVAAIVAEAQGLPAPSVAPLPSGRPRDELLPSPPGSTSLSAEASARSRKPREGPFGAPEASARELQPAEPPPISTTGAPPKVEADALAAAEPEMAAPAVDSGLMKVALAAPRAASASFLAAGEKPPPVYRTVLPGPVTLRYELRRGFFKGTGEIRWRPDGDRYALQFEARVAGISLLSQSSQGELDATGLAPLRFIDQRARKAARAVNFSRDTATISFSGSTAQWPLLAGTQDRLSWMIQLGGIVAADPALATGGRISMVLVSARGEAAVRSVHFAGKENAETVSGSVASLKFVVDGHSAHDGSFEIWLDPARGYLPARAASRSSSGDVEYELLFLRAEP